MDFPSKNLQKNGKNLFYNLCYNVQKEIYKKKLKKYN